MANTNTVLAAVAGLALGAGITYVALDKRTQAAPKKKKAPDIPPGPGPDQGLPGQQGPGTVPGAGYYRDPMPNTSVDLPMSVGARRALDAEICNSIAAFEEAPEPSDVALTTLHQVAPQVEWPSVPGDHPTIISLQSMVVFRVDQVSSADPGKTVHENMADFCKPDLGIHPIHPIPKSPDPGGDAQWDPPQGG